MSRISSSIPPLKPEVENEEETIIIDEETIRKAIHGNYEDKGKLQELVKNMTPEELFKTFDTDDSALIDFNEFRNMLPFLGIDISAAKAFRYFNICDSDGSGEIDIDEFKVALFTCDPTSGNPVGYQPSKFLTPLDAFETFDEDRSGFLDEDEFHFAMEYLNVEITDAKEEILFNKYDFNHVGSIDYIEFRELFITACDVKKELEDRGIDAPVLSKRTVLEDILREVIEEEETRERRAIAEAKRYKLWQHLCKEKRKELQKAHWRSYQELRSALDAAGQVYVFGSGTYNQFSNKSIKELKSNTYKFDQFERVVEIWQDRVRPEQLINRLRLQRRAEEQQMIMDARRNGQTIPEETFDQFNELGGLGDMGGQEAEFKANIDPYKEALKSKFKGLNVAVNTAALWGRRIHHVSISDNVIFALADTGEIFSWGGSQHWWNEVQPDSIYQSKWRGDSTPRSQLLLGTVDRILNTDPMEEQEEIKVAKQSEEEHKCDVIKVITKYFNVWEPPPGAVNRMKYFEKDLLPKLRYDDIKLALECRGKEIVEATKLELMEEFYNDIMLEKRLLGERAHKAIRELETQVQGLRRRRKLRMAEKIRHRIEEMWLPLLEVQAERKASEKASEAANAHFAVMKVEDDYVKWRGRIKEKREAMHEKRTPRGNSLQINVSGITPRGNSLVTPRSYQSALQISAGSSHVCLIHKSGELYSWGVGAAGRLGLDVTEAGDPQRDSTKPRLVQALVGRPTLKVSCGYSHSGAVTAGGDLFMWGSAASGKCGLGEVVKEQDCFCSVPTKLALGPGYRARKVACGSMHTAVVTEAGQLFVFGCGDGGRLGLGRGNFHTHYSPVLVESLLHERISSVSCGNSSTVVSTEIKHDWVGDDESRYRVIVGGKVYIAGSCNVFGRAYEEFTYLKSMEGNPVKQISAGYQHTALVTAEGELYTWGNNRSVCCGVAPAVAFIEQPMLVSCLYETVRNLSVGKSAVQSSTYNSREAEYAVNGDISGFGLKRVTSTQQDPQAWWEVDLGHVAMIDSIKIWNRTDMPHDQAAARDQYTSRLFPFWVMVGPQPFSREVGAASLYDSLRDSTAKAKFTEPSRVSVWRCPSNTQGRYVRIQLEGFNYLTLAEVQVFGNYGLTRGVGRVSYADAGRDVTAVVIRACNDPRDIESRYKRAAYADSMNADILRQLETFALGYDKYGRGEIISKCEICQPHSLCEICSVRQHYEDEIKKMPAGIGGRRRRLKSIDEYLINANKPDLVPIFPKRMIRPTRFQLLKKRIGKRFNNFIRSFGGKGAQISADDEALIRSFDAAQITKVAAADSNTNQSIPQVRTTASSGDEEATNDGSRTMKTHMTDDERREEIKKKKKLLLKSRILDAESDGGQGISSEAPEVPGRDAFPKSIRNKMKKSDSLILRNKIVQNLS